MEVFATMVLGLALLFASSMLPALAALRILDPEADQVRRMLMAPAIGVLILLGLAGWSVILSGGFSSIFLLLLIAVLNLFSVRYLLNTQQQVESIAAVADRDLLWLAVALVLFCSLLPLFLFKVPNGVDWIGFSTLANLYASSGHTDLPSPNIGSWTYPPAFPALAALLQVILDIPASDAVHLLGRICLLALILGLGGIADRWGAGTMTMVACALGFGLFVKAHDSGYPTVAAQLGIIFGAFIILRADSQRMLRHDLAIALAILCSGVIHPTGAIYLTLLFIVDAVFRRFGSNASSEKNIRSDIASTIGITIAAIVTLFIFSPRMLDLPVDAEYGWQGGGSLLLFNGPVLLGLGLWSVWRYRCTRQGAVLSAWLASLWLLTFIHLLVGLEILPILTLFSFVLYSMAMHAFHIPLALLAGMLLSPSFSTAENDAADGASVPEWLPKAAISVALIFIIVGQSALLVLSNHQEVLLHAEGDDAIMKHLTALPEGSIVYTEQAHWGYIIEPPEHVMFTSYPILGLVDEKYSIQDLATSAIRADDTDVLGQLGIAYAISSPMSLLGASLVESRYWSVMAEESGARLWSLSSQPDTQAMGMMTTPRESDCRTDCEWRLDPWREHRWWGHENISDHRAFLTEGSIYWRSEVTADMIGRNLSLELYFDAPDDLEVTFSSDCAQDSRTILSEGGWQTIRLQCDPSGEVMNLSVRVEGGGGLWLNPQGLTGRDDRLFDKNGVRIHWIEVQIQD